MVLASTLYVPLNQPMLFLLSLFSEAARDDNSEARVGMQLPPDAARYHTFLTAVCLSLILLKSEIHQKHLITMGSVDDKYQERGPRPSGYLSITKHFWSLIFQFSWNAPISSTLLRGNS